MGTLVRQELGEDFLISGIEVAYNFQSAPRGVQLVLHFNWVKLFNNFTYLLLEKLQILVGSSTFPDYYLKFNYS